MSNPCDTGICNEELCDNPNCIDETFPDTMLVEMHVSEEQEKKYYEKFK